MNLVDLIISKKAKPEDVDSFIERWHMNEFGDVTLSEVLGFDEAELLDDKTIIQATIDAVNAKKLKKTS